MRNFLRRVAAGPNQMGEAPAADGAAGAPRAGGGRLYGGRVGGARQVTRGGGGVGVGI